jgi:hypothetical protein
MAHKIPVLNSTDKLKKSVALHVTLRSVSRGGNCNRFWCRLGGKRRWQLSPGSSPEQATLSSADQSKWAIDIRAWCQDILSREQSTLYIPAKLPPAEIGGCRFVEPQSPSWRDYHRSAVPPSSLPVYEAS